MMHQIIDILSHQEVHYNYLDHAFLQKAPEQLIRELSARNMSRFAKIEN